MHLSDDSSPQPQLYQVRLAVGKAKVLDRTYRARQFSYLNRNSTIGFPAVDITTPRCLSKALANNLIHGTRFADPNAELHHALEANHDLYQRIQLVVGHSVSRMLRDLPARLKPLDLIVTNARAQEYCVGFVC